MFKIVSSFFILLAIPVTIYLANNPTFVNSFAASKSPQTNKIVSNSKTRYLSFRFDNKNRFKEYFFTDKIKYKMDDPKRLGKYRLKVGKFLNDPISIEKEVSFVHSKTGKNKTLTSTKTETTLITFSVSEQTKNFELVDANKNVIQKAVQKPKTALEKKYLNKSVDYTYLHTNTENRNQNDTLDIVFYPVGYDSASYSSFVNTVESYKSGITNNQSFFAKNLNRINIIRINEWNQGDPSLCQPLFNWGCLNSELASARITSVNADTTVFVFNSNVYGYFSYGDKGLTYVTKQVTPLEVLHEIGHSFGGMYDEYLILPPGQLTSSLNNCKLSCSEFDQRYVESCSQECSGTNAFRTKFDSLMRYPQNGPEYSNYQVAIMSNKINLYAPDPNQPPLPIDGDDFINPKVIITSPSEGGTVFGFTRLKAIARDDRHVRLVMFTAEDPNSIYTLTRVAYVEPFEVDFDFNEFPNAKRIRVTALDDANNNGQAVVNITVAAPPAQTVNIIDVPAESTIYGIYDPAIDNINFRVPITVGSNMSVLNYSIVGTRVSDGWTFRTDCEPSNCVRSTEFTDTLYGLIPYVGLGPDDSLYVVYAEATTTAGNKIKSNSYKLNLYPAINK